MSRAAEAPARLANADFCPYVGLAPFEADHADYYFGRDLDAATLADNVLGAPVTVLYGASGHVSPLLQLGLALLVLPVVPWVVIRARRFALRNTAYRNIRFDFAAGYGEAIAVYLLWPMIVAFSAMLLHPLYVWQRAKFLVENAAFGMQAVGFVAQKGAYYLAYLKFLLVFMLVLMAGGVGVGAAMAGADPGRVPVTAPLVLVATMLALLATLSYKHVLVTNLSWSGIEIGGMRSHCALETPRMYWIALSNLVAIVASVGLLIPWATIRMARYRVESMSLAQAENLESLVAAQTETIGAAGEEIGELLGIDVGL